jgi:hypothetical protein
MKYVAYDRLIRVQRCAWLQMSQAYSFGELCRGLAWSPAKFTSGITDGVKGQHTEIVHTNILITTLHRVN